MDILEKARRLEGNIARGMIDAANTLVRGGDAREPIELAHAIVDAVEHEIQSGGRGTRVFPFNTIDVSLLAPSDQARARLEAVVDGDVPLRHRIAERLRAAGCRDTELVVRIDYVPLAPEHWTNPQFSIAFSRLAREAPVVEAPEDGPARIELTVTRGAAERWTYLFTAHRIDLGRGNDVRDSRNGLVRTNQVAFSEADDLNRSVSRQHAHIVYDRQAAQFRLYDDGSVHGTRIVRKGKTLAVPWGGRGGRLRSGDEIELGEARVRVRF
jgi:hypothetical protein